MVATFVDHVQNVSHAMIMHCAVLRNNGGTTAAESSPS